MSIFESLKHRRRSHSPDLLILWEWEFDDDFIFYLAAFARQLNLHALAISPAEFDHFFTLCHRDNFSPVLVVDRASDVHLQLLPCLAALKQRGAFLINDPDHVAWSRDKATMHLELVSDGVSVPYGIILSHHDHPEQVFPFAAEKLGIPFVIKPSEGGGGEGVVLDATQAQDIRHALVKSRTGKLVLQEKITPQVINDRRAWFRIFYLLGHVIPCWWDDITHLYAPVSPAELNKDIVSTISEVIQKIAKTCRLAFFTSELALDQNNKLQVIDFVNEMCDMRMRSRHQDGVPDHIIFDLVRTICTFCSNLSYAKASR